MEVSFTMYPVTPTSSVAVKLVIEMVNDDDVAGMTKAVTVGGVVSARVTVVVALFPAETLPAASLAQA